MGAVTSSRQVCEPGAGHVRGQQDSGEVEVRVNDGLELGVPFLVCSDDE